MLPVLCPRCDLLLGWVLDDEFRPEDVEYVQADAYEPNGVHVWELKCRCGKERRWPQ